MFPVLRPILNKGGAGRYISREASIERLTPIVDEHLRLFATYEAALDGMEATHDKAAIEALLPFYRTEMAKIYETMFSLGGSASTGAHGAPEVDPVGSTTAERVKAIIKAENEFQDKLSAEVDAVHHQERTRAILGHNARASEPRQIKLREIAQRLSRD